ncbi:MAG: DNA repair protein RecO [Proteobacteria bacterium]|jgi:DNA repair protein RecO (recombination protein O)|nr:DNA repair protein RecO [Pseudomonadota bacterium]MDA0869562.1 DNA repair protein RecO [Pseudomonadota bacterium]MDA1328233.1 DNA repair protein RecO [Pseudomonadota bacterium]
MARARILDQPGYVLHRYDWSEHSAIVEVFTRDYGRVALVAKGVKRPASQLRAVLLPLQPLLLGFTGEAEVRTLTSAHWSGGYVMPRGEPLLAGFYLNELVLRLLARDDPYPELFAVYQQAVAALTQVAAPGPVLRAFELRLLQGLGVLPLLSQQGTTLAPLVPQQRYRLQPELGLVQANADAPALQAEVWLALGQAMQADWSALCMACTEYEAPLRQLVRPLLQHHGGLDQFATRQMWAQAQQMAPAGRKGHAVQGVTP